MPKQIDGLSKSKTNNTIDLRPFFSEINREEDFEDFDNDDNEIENSVSINQLSIDKEKQSKKQVNIETPIKVELLKFALKILKSITYGLIVLYQRFYDYIKGIEFGGSKNFERKFSRERKFYLGISLPDSVQSVNDVFFYYPLLSKKMAYEILSIRKDSIKNYNSVFTKK